MNNKIYHYTNLEGIKGILESKELRLSSAQHIIQKSKKKNKENGFSIVEEHLFGEYLEEAFIKFGFDLRYLENFYRATCRPLLNISYILSLTSSSHSSFHWENYAQESGVALKIREDTFKRFSNSNNCWYQCGEVCYDSVHFLRRDIREYIYAIIANGFNTRTHTKSFLRAIAFSKYREYEQEKEVRIVLRVLENRGILLLFLSILMLILMLYM